MIWSSLGKAPSPGNLNADNIYAPLYCWNWRQAKLSVTTIDKLAARNAYWTYQISQAEIKQLEHLARYCPQTPVTLKSYFMNPETGETITRLPAGEAWNEIRGHYADSCVRIAGDMENYSDRLYELVQTLAADPQYWLEEVTRHGCVHFSQNLNISENEKDKIKKILTNHLPRSNEPIDYSVVDPDFWGLDLEDGQ